MRTFRRLAKIALALVVAAVVLVAVARIGRRATEAPTVVVSGVWRERNLIVDVYGARSTSGSILLFDAGLDRAGGALDELLGALGATRAEVRHVFLTHGHFDHVAAAPLCAQARIHVGAPDVEFLAQRAPVVGTAMVKLFNFVWPVPPVSVTEPLDGRVEIDVGGGERVVALPTPGHTPGSYVFVYRGVLFAGDSMIVDGSALSFAMSAFSVDPEANRRAVAALGDELRGVDVQVVCTGHQGCTPPGRGAAMLADLIARAKGGR
jgi:glyoxylase-like metal-dependent hydrolase (beta-lactamase superfamily II)